MMKRTPEIIRRGLIRSGDCESRMQPETRKLADLARGLWGRRAGYQLASGPFSLL